MELPEIIHLQELSRSGSLVRLRWVGLRWLPKERSGSVFISAIIRLSPPSTALAQQFATGSLCRAKRSLYLQINRKKRASTPCSILRRRHPDSQTPITRFANATAFARMLNISSAARRK
jgi:hypothetical protein